jgi:hypothetical protein
MGLKSALPLAAAAMLALSAFGATAQEAAAPARAAAHPAYSDSQMSAFAHATVELQALGTQDPSAQTRAIERSGLRVEDYNSMGDAMRADPALAASLNPYLDQANAERTARITRIPPSARSYAAPARHTRAKAHSTRHRSVRSHGKHHAGKATRHASSRHRHTAKSTHRHATHTTTHHRRRHR